MIKNFVSLRSIVSDFVEDNDVRQTQIDENLIKKWGETCASWLTTADQMVAHRTIILDVDRGKTKYPADLQKIVQVAYRKSPPPTSKTRNEQISQWIQHTYDPDQKLEINLITKGCDEPNCDDAYVEVDVDRIWEMSHPEIYYRGFFRKVTWGKGGGAKYNDDHIFRIMNYSTNDFFGVNMHIPDCLNIVAPDINETYVLNPPYIEVEFERGELLLSYLGKRTDEFGDLMVPDHPSAIQAVYFYMTYKWFWLEFSRTGDNAALRKLRMAEEQYKTHLSEARAAISMPDYNKLKPILLQNFAKRVPAYNNDDKYNREMPDEYDIRRNLFDY